MPTTLSNYGCFDTVIKTYLIKKGDLYCLTSPMIGLCAESHCLFPQEPAIPLLSALRAAPELIECKP